MIVTALIFAFSMFTVAGQLSFFYQAPFFFNWLVIGLGELLSMSLGSSGFLNQPTNKFNEIKTRRVS
nr:hypothetical protein [Enterococcus viikkiensis]